MAGVDESCVAAGAGWYKSLTATIVVLEPKSMFTGATSNIQVQQAIHCLCVTHGPLVVLVVWTNKL